MAFIGNTVQTQGFTPQIDYFNGNGSTVTFTLSRPVVSVAQMIVAVDNVIQNPSSAYTVSGSSITFTSAPLSGTNNIWVEYTSLITTYAALSQSPSVVGDITASGGYLAVGNFGASFVDGTIVDYVTGNGRITAGPADGITLYTGGTSARTALAAWDPSGNLTNTGGAVIQGLTVGKGGGTAGTVFGYQAANSTTGPNNTAIGYQALYTNAGGDTNVAVGYRANYSNTTGTNNVGVGKDAIYSVTTGVNNTGIGDSAGRGCTGNVSTFVGANAGIVATGSSNTFIGCSAGEAVTSGAKNTILGRYNGNQGSLDIRTASNYIVLSDGDGNPKGYFSSATGAWHFNNNVANNTMQIYNTFATPYGPYIEFTNASPNNTSQYFLQGADSTNAKFFVYSNGTVSNRTGTYNTISDQKIKQDIVDAGSQWDDIKAVRFRKYRLIDDVKANADAPYLLGVVAQELEQTSPALIDNCEDKDTKEITKGVKTSVLLMKAAKALQEAMERIETLEAKVTALESK